MFAVTLTPSLLPAKPLQPRREFRVFRRRRLKINSSSDNLFPSSSLDFNFITPAALTLASAAALFLSRFNNNNNSNNPPLSDLGEWILFASPTPFNRFVVLRCPSITFEGSDDVSERLVREEKHYVAVSNGRIQVKKNKKKKRKRERDKEELSYQRVCVNTPDGGVVSLDWPANLDLEQERGLDSTLLLVPGTPQGSADDDIKFFVVEALKRGYFPVVMNPRGCASSPLTTPRLFTAADSDDICTAITYINKARPWTTLMGVGWGYGANMLTKYLAEVGERTPLTAATCIDNPFDLDEATKVSPYRIVTDQRLIGGLVDILQTNKALFQGKTKGFDVEKALLAKSVRDFEEAISMVSYGFGDIEDFYTKSSTRNMIRDVKIPVLFIQSDNGMVPVFSVPRNLIAENPFTSLLLCSCLPSNVMDTDMSALSWCQLLTIEWLTAVELGLLKGRHPLLTDLDVTINPSKGLAVLEQVSSDKKGNVNKLLDLARSDASNGYSLGPTKDSLEESKNNASLHLRSQQEPPRNFEQVDISLQVKDGPLQQTSSSDADSTEEENDASVDSEHGQGLQAAQVVINMLDVTMPGTLTEDKKKKVLTAVGQGETLMKALQDAVPEDVRGKLTDAVTGIMHAEGSDLKFDKILGIGQAPKPSPGQKNQEKSTGVSSGEVKSEDKSSLNQIKTTNSSTDGSDNALSGRGEPAEGTETEGLPLEISPNSTNLAQPQESNDEVGSSGSLKKETGESSDNNNTKEELKGKAVPDIDHREKGLETGSKPSTPSHSDEAGGLETVAVADEKSQNGGIPQTETGSKPSTPSHSDEAGGLETVAVADEKSQNGGIPQTETGSKPSTPSHSDEAGGLETVAVADEKSQNGGIPQTDTQENKTMKAEQKSQDVSSDQSKATSSDAKDEPSSPSLSSEHQTIEKEGNDNEKEDNKNVQHISQKPNSTNSDSGASDFSVSQALGALTGMDDSTQVAINSVFGVIENVLTQIEQSSENEDKDSDGKDVEHKVGGQKKDNSQINDSITDDDPSVDNHPNGTLLKNDSCDTEEQLTQSLSTINGSGVFNSHNCNSNDHPVKKESNTNGQLAAKSSPLDKWDGQRQVSRMPEFIPAGSYSDSPYKEYLRKYLVSEISAKSLDLNTTTALLLGYFPKEGQWKLSEQPQNMEIASADSETYEAACKMKAYSSAKSDDAEQYIEPPYVILDSEKQQEPVKEIITTDTGNKMSDTGDDRSEELIQLVKNRVLDSLKMEVGRKLNSEEMIEMKSMLAGDLEYVADMVSLAVVDGMVPQQNSESHDVGDAVEKIGTLDGEHIIRVISSSVQQTSCLRKVVPVGVIVGSILATLRIYFNVATLQDNGRGRNLDHDNGEKTRKNNHDMVGVTDIDQVPDEKISVDHPINRELEESESENASKSTVMVGAVTAALGASALLIQQKDPQIGNETAESSSTYLNMKEHHQKEPQELKEDGSEKSQSNLVTSLAEKAMSVASPVVPTKEGGEVDQQRLVTMLADLGQRGGLLRLVGKIALLWGGIRGAMSLTDKLISFSHIAERPLIQRIFGFVGLILVLWSPVAIPLLPTIVQSFTMKTPSKVAEFACIIGLYTATMILVMLWGKRIRGYQNSFEQYGLDLTSSQKRIEFLKGFAGGFGGGVIFVFSIHAVNAFIGCASFSWPHTPPSDAMTWLRVCGQMGLVVVQGTVMASAISMVEELLFRSWLPQEIAVDVGYHQGIIISGLAFSILQRCLQAIPGLWLLSLSLSGFRERNGGSLSIPIGIRTGMMASTFFLKNSGLLTYYNKPNFPTWIMGPHPFQPFSGLVGLVFALSLAVLLYPKRTSLKREILE